MALSRPMWTQHLRSRLIVHPSVALKTYERASFLLSLPACPQLALNLRFSALPSPNSKRPTSKRISHGTRRNYNSATTMRRDAPLHLPFDGKDVETPIRCVRTLLFPFLTLPHSFNSFLSQISNRYGAARG